MKNGKSAVYGFWIVVSFFGAQSAFANKDLAAAMDTMASAYTQIGKQVTDSTQNASSASLCDTMTTAIETAKTLTPDTISTLPADQQASQEEAYVSLLTQLEGQVATLKADFVAGNTAAAEQEIAAINATKKQGHGSFN